MKDPQLTPEQEAALRKLDRFVEWFILVGFISIVLLVCCSCSSTKGAPQSVEHGGSLSSG